MIVFQNKQLAYTIYNAAAKGTPLVLLHGFGEDSRIWQHFIQDFPMPVITPDIGGLGSSEPLATYSIDNMADSVLALVQHLQYEKIILIGHSLGGYVGLAFAERHPAYLAGLGLFHSHPFADAPEKQEHRRKVADFILRNGSKVFVEELIPKLFHPDYLAQAGDLLKTLIERGATFAPESLAGCSVAMAERPDRAAVLEQIACPVLFIIGRDDTAVTWQQSTEQTYLPPVADVHILDAVNHMGMFEATDKTRQIVLDFYAFCHQ